MRESHVRKPLALQILSLLSVQCVDALVSQNDNFGESIHKQPKWYPLDLGKNL